MGDNQWLKIREVFDATLHQPPEERRNFINKACGDDKTLLTEIESLFTSYDKFENFLETPAIAQVADLIEHEKKTLESGKKFGHYETVKQIGMGGMGEVYLALDKKLDRKVAVKILKERFSQDKSNLRRFMQEAKAASALNHPNILVIHEIGAEGEEQYIVSEFIEGETLREILSEKTCQLAQVLDISIQIANALSAAHEVHLIHRDIKPENIMIRPDGFVKVLDFGLAKLVEEEKKSFLGLEDSTARQAKTEKGVILGTVNYMSPEQAKAERVDEGTDIFSLGVVIYEMVAGRTPFTGNSASETFANLINKEAQPLSHFAANTPDEVQRIVGKMLRKDRDERYQSMKDVLTDLKELKENLVVEKRLERTVPPNGESVTVPLQTTRGDANKSTAKTLHSFSQQIKRHKLLAAFVSVVLLIGAIASGYYFFFAGKASSSAGGRKSIAVLPVKPINTANRNEIYEFGIAESLILKLNSTKKFIVRPLSATRKYTDINQDPVAAGREQKADYVLASNYQLADGKIKITSQLFNVATGQVEDTYKSEKDVTNVFAMQDAIAGEIGNFLLTRFATTSDDMAVKRGTTNEEAYRLYLQGMYLIDGRNAADSRKGVEILDKAVKLDPNYAQAWAGKAHAHLASHFGRDVDLTEQRQKTLEAIDRALALDANSADALSALCETKFSYEWNFDGAEAACKRAVELNPDSSLAHQIYARHLNSRGRFDEAISEIKIAIDLEPASLFNQRLYGNCLQYARRYDEAVAQFKRVAEMDENFGTTFTWLSMTLAIQGKEAEAFEVWMKILERQKADKETIHTFQTAFQTSGWQGVMRVRTERFEKGNELYFHGAAYNALAGNKDKAFEYLEKSYQRREWGMAYLKVDPRLDNIRNDPRFVELVRRVGLK